MDTLSSSFIRDLSQEITTFSVEEKFFASLAAYLAKALNVKYLFIGYLTEAGNAVKTVALYTDGHIVENKTFSVKSTPHEQVIEKAFCHYPNGVLERFPNDRELTRMHVCSYIGTSFFSNRGKPSGLMVAMDTKPFAKPELARNLFEIAARRAENEMDQVVKKDMELALREAHKVNNALETLLETSKAIASEVELEKVVQKITDVASQLSGAEFGAFFYNVENPEGDKYLLYTVSGVPKEAFSKFPNPRNTKIFGPTFSGTRTVRYSDVTQQPHFGKNGPYYGMPEGHLPVKSYLAVPVISPNTKSVIGGLFFGHSEAGVFTEASEKMVEGIAAQGAIAMENARLFEEKNRTEEKFRESEKKFHGMADAVPVMVWITRPDGYCIYLNKPWYDYTGQTETTALGMKWVNALHPDDVEKTGQIFLEANESHKPFSIEYRLKSKNGNFRWMLVTGFPKHDVAGNYEGFIGVVVDIHERKLAEEALEEQKQQYESIFNSTSDAILIFDDEGNLEEVNPAAYRMHGYTYEEFMGLNVKNLIHPDDFQKFSDLVKTITEGKKFFVSGQHLKKDGSFIDVDLTGIGFTYKGKLHLMAVIRDITIQKKAQTALKAKEQTLRLALEATSLGTFDLNPQTGKLVWSDRCKELFGIPLDAEVDYPLFLDCLHPDHRERVNDAVEWAYNPESGGSYEIEYCVIARDNGVHRWIKATGKTYFDEHNQPLRFIGTVQDITEQTLKQQELEEKTRELEFANEDLRNFTYTITHDIKNPLSNLLMATSLTKYFTTLEEYKQVIVLIDKSTRKINDIVEGLLKIIKEETTVKKAETIDIEATIAGIKFELAEEMAASNFEIKTDIKKKHLWYIRGYLESILRNLISNAVKYRTPGTRLVICITVQGHGPFTELIIADNGLGIDLKQHQRNLFQPFKRIHKNIPGTGIGLFMIKRMIEKYGGSISVESQPGKGTSFHIKLASVNLMADMHPSS